MIQKNERRRYASDLSDSQWAIITDQDGLFPSPREIGFSYSCPDLALMCKHVVATLYGIGARLDENPSLFFELRGIEVGRFVDVAIANRVELMLKNVGRESARTIRDEEILELFGV